jgi:hypothetical protein
MGSPAAKVTKTITNVVKKEKATTQQPPSPPTSSPTSAEISQATAAYIYDTRKTKRRGRSLTIQTGPTGVEESLTLGKKSLLGQ